MHPDSEILLDLISISARMSFRLNTLWALMGLPLGILTLLHYVYKYCRTQKVNLKGKVVFITGASSGLGAACAEVFHEAGCRLVLSGRQVQKLLDLKAKLTQKQINDGDEPAIVTMDLEDLDSIEAKVKQVISAFGHVDVVINNAGMSFRGLGCETKLDVHKTIMAVNYFAQIEITRVLLEHFIARKQGHIVTISSVQGKVAIPNRTAYAASKHALQAYFDCLRAEIAHQNINVSVVSPYYISTNMSKNAITDSGHVYGVTDDTEKIALTPEYVASKVLKCVVNKIDDMIVSPFHVPVAIALRTMAPWLINTFLEMRAAGERNAQRKTN